MVATKYGWYNTVVVQIHRQPHTLFITIILVHNRMTSNKNILFTFITFVKHP